MLFTVVSQFEYAFFAWSIRLLDVSAATIRFETDHAPVILLTAWLFRKASRYRKIDRDTVLLIILAFTGFASVVASQSGRPDGPGVKGGSEILPGADLRKALSTPAGGRQSRDCLELFSVLTASIIANAVAIPLSLVAGAVSRETITPGLFRSGVGAGFAVNATANIAWRVANLSAGNLGVNAISYATPVLSLAWLFLFSQVHPPRVDYLIAGVAIIVAAHLLILRQKARP